MSRLDTRIHLLRRIDQFITSRPLDIHFQSIIRTATAEIIGYEALTRPRADTAWPSPTVLFQTAREAGRLPELEMVCLEQSVQAFCAQDLPGLLFLNLSAASLLGWPDLAERLSQVFSRYRLATERVVIELTEQGPPEPPDRLRQCVRLLHGLRMRIAVDDLGDNVTSWHHWTELQPDIVKIDRRLVAGVATNPLRLQVLEALQRIAETASMQVVAEGIETPADLLACLDVGVVCAQGFLIGLPDARPEQGHASQVQPLVARHRVESFRLGGPSGVGDADQIERLILLAPCLHRDMAIADAAALLHAHPECDLLAVVDEERRVLGVIDRHQLGRQLTHPYFKEVYGRRTCLQAMTTEVLIVPHHTPVLEVGLRLSQQTAPDRASGYVVTVEGRYRGVGRAQDLLHAISALQVEAARSANPLTHLPGNRTLDRRLAEWLFAEIPFTAVYFDFDHFKPFNDEYGFLQGDRMIRMFADLLVESASPALDFVAHVGGDDFVALWQSPDWELRSRRLLSEFSQRAMALYTPKDQARGGIQGVDRFGVSRFFPCVAASAGAIRIDGPPWPARAAVSQAMSLAKQHAKDAGGNQLYWLRDIHAAQTGAQGTGQTGSARAHRPPRVEILGLV